MSEISATSLAGQRAKFVRAHDSTGALSPLTGKKDARTVVRCDRMIGAACLMKCCGGKSKNKVEMQRYEMKKCWAVCADLWKIDLVGKLI